MTKRALVTGITGQDGYYLAEHLSDLGYQVFGQTRNPRNASHDLLGIPVHLLSFDLTSTLAWKSTFEEYDIDEVYHLAGVSFVPTSWSAPCETITANVHVTSQLLEAMRTTDRSPRLFYACSSEVFGHPAELSQNENTPRRPLNPYGVTKAASMGLIECYRNRYDLFACSGILFNHESPRRDPAFVTRKITRGVAAIRMGLQDRLTLGNLDVSRDWGYAVDFVDCMHRMLSVDTPADYVIGTGRLTSLQALVDAAFRHAGLNWSEWVDLDPRFNRPNETKTLVADSSKALAELGWQATTSIEQLIELMVDHDLSLLSSNSRVAA